MPGRPRGARATLLLTLCISVAIYNHSLLTLNTKTRSVGRHLDQSKPTTGVERRRLRRLGPASLILAGLLVLATLPLIPLIIPSLNPSSTQSGLVALETEGTLYATTWILYLVSDLLYLVGFFALYYSLRLVSKGVAAIAVALNTIFVAADVAIDIPLRLWLISLSSAYASATGNAQQALSSADFAITASNLVALVATLFQFTALILISYLMRRSPNFGARVGYVGIASGIVALLFIPAFLVAPQLAGLFNIGGFVLLVVWSLLAGFKLRRSTPDLQIRPSTEDR